jgi:hypothetical protein
MGSRVKGKESWAEKITRQIEEAAERALHAAGVDIAQSMKAHIADGVEGPSRLEDSVTYATKRVLDRNMVGPRAADEHVIKQPTEANVLKVGTASPYAKYVNWGSLPIGQGPGAGAEPGSLREHILDWAIEKFGDSEETRDFAEGVVQKVIREGTTGFDFLGMTRADAQRIMATTFASAFRLHSRQGFVPTVTEIPVNIDMSYTKGAK